VINEKAANEHVQLGHVPDQPECLVAVVVVFLLFLCVYLGLAQRESGNIIRRKWPNRRLTGRLPYGRIPGDHAWPDWGVH
jgi:hypothetical protein